MLRKLSGLFQSSPARRRRTAPAPVCEVQSLETKTMLTGNVTVSVKAGVANIKGDNLDNEIRIHQHISGRAFIEGLNGTTVNGNGAFFHTSTTFNGLKVNMKGGNDKVDLVETDVTGNVNAKMGSGDDVFSTFGQTIGGSAKINLGSANASEVAIINNSTIDGALQIKGGRGTHIVRFIDANLQGPTVVNLGGGNDVLNIDFDSVFATPVKTNGGSGNDFIFTGGNTLNHKNYEDMI